MTRQRNLDIHGQGEDLVAGTGWYSIYRKQTYCKRKHWLEKTTRIRNREVPAL